MCRAGSANSLPGAAEALACVSCAPGTFSANDGAVGCELCPLGTASNATAATKCVGCLPGSEAPQFG